MTRADAPTDAKGDGGAAPAGKRRFGRRKAPKLTHESAFDRMFTSGAKWLLARGVHPNHFTFMQIPVFLFTILAAVQQWEWPFALTTIAVMVLDGGDGILARVGHLESKTGVVLDALFDTMGISILIWGATQFHPEAEGWLLLLLLANVLLFLQNSLLDDKMVSYVRGPVVAAVVFPQAVLGALLVASITVGFLLLVRAPKGIRAMMRLGLQ